MIKKVLVAVVVVFIMAGAPLTKLFEQEPKILYYLGCDWVVPKEFQQVNQGRYVKDDAAVGSSSITYYQHEDPDSKSLKQHVYSLEYKASFSRIELENDLIIDNLFKSDERSRFTLNAIIITKVGDDNAFFLGQLDVEDAVTFTQNCIEESLIREIFDRYAAWLEENQFKKVR